MAEHVSGLDLDFAAANAVSSIYRAANAVRAHVTNVVLRPNDLTWTGFVVLWVVWIWDGMETRRVAESAAISKATLTGVVKTLESRGWIVREGEPSDRRLVRLRLTAEGTALMERVYPEFNAVEAQVVARLSVRHTTDLARSLRTIVRTIEDDLATDDDPDRQVDSDTQDAST